MIWWLKGEDNVKYLQENGCKFWNKDADEKTGWVGLNYGLMTNWPVGHKDEKINQLANIIEKLADPHKSYSKNLVVTMS